jgi:hypothetical protein
VHPILATRRRHASRPNKEKGRRQEEHAEQRRPARCDPQGRNQYIAQAEEREQQGARTPRHGGTLHRNPDPDHDRDRDPDPDPDRDHDRDRDRDPDPDPDPDRASMGPSVVRVGRRAF